MSTIAHTELKSDSESKSYSPEELNVLSLSQTHTYEEVSAITGWSRGKIWRLRVAAGARKHEDRISAKREQRMKEQQDILASIINTTIKSDVLDFLDGIPNDSTSLVFTSPPYNIGKKYGESATADAMHFTYFHGWLMQIIAEIARILKPGGVVCLNVGKTMDWTNQLFPMDIMLFENLRRSGLTFQNRVIWTIPHGLTPKGRLADRHETILIFSKGEQATFNPNVARMPQKQPSKRAFKGPNKGELSGHPFGAFPTDVWSDIPTVRHNHPEKSFGAHPAQFPVMLAKRAILLYTNAGELVVDPFSGSGTTNVAAVETGRSFTGADLFYEDLRAKRIANAKLDAFTPLPGVSDESVEVWQAEARKVSLDAVAVEQTDQQQFEQLRFF